MTAFGPLRRAIGQCECLLEGPRPQLDRGP